MHLFDALIHGIVQGLTEFLPISSTAHVAITQQVLHWPPKEIGAPFTAVIQLGTLLAVLVYFWNDLRRTFVGWILSFRGGDLSGTPEARLGWAAFWGTLPIVILGFALSGWIEGELRSLYVIAASLIGLALLLGVAESVAKKTRSLDEVKPIDGIVIGLFQAMALVPGVSRSGSTITGGLFLGFDRETAARLSFILSVPSVLLAGLYSLYKHRHELMSAGTTEVIVATLAAFVVGYLSIGFLLRFLRTRSTMPFIVYRIVLGSVLLWLLSQQILTAFA